MHGLGLWLRSPRLMVLGAAPALMVGVIYLVALVLLAMNLPAVAVFLTPFASDWADAARVVVEVIAAVAVLGLVAVLAVLSFTMITLLVGAGFYETIWRAVESRAGDVPEPRSEPFFRGLGRAIGESLRLLLATAVIGLALFVGGFIPVVGQSVIPVIAVGVGGWFLAVELTGFAFDARGLRLRARRRVLGAHRARTLGFGMATFVVFLLPLGAVVAMPAAVAGATLLSRSLLPDDAAAPETPVTGTTPGQTSE